MLEEEASLCFASLPPSFLPRGPPRRSQKEKQRRGQQLGSAFQTRFATTRWRPFPPIRAIRAPVSRPLPFWLAPGVFRLTRGLVCPDEVSDVM